MYTVTVVSQALMFLVMLVVLLAELKVRTVISHHRTAPFLWLLSSDVVMLAFMATKWLLLENAALGRETAFTHLLFVIVACIEYIAYYTLLSSFVYFVVDYIFQKTRISFWWAHITVPVGVIFTFLCCASLFTDDIFYIFKDGIFLHGPLYWLSGFCGYFVVLVTVVLVFYYRRFISVGDQLSILSFVVLPLFVQVLPRLRTWCSMQVALSLSILCIYCFIHIKQAYEFQKRETEFAQGKIKVMLSQISPHFIFNVLNSLYVLCDKDIYLTKNAIADFSKYLRGNLESLLAEQEIPFEKELDSVRFYLNLEKLRFQEDLRVVYNITETDFMLPPLTLQPIVENAVKHGIITKKGGGTVTISTKKTADFYEIIVQDDGVGFNADKEADSSKVHVGIKNVRNRLWLMSRGTLTVESEPYAGTKVTIHIPSKEA